jgi:hypothetical protein
MNRYVFSDQFKGLTNAEINHGIGLEQRELLRQWLRTGADAANKASVATPPAGLTAETLRAYHEIARRQIAAGVDPVGTQSARIRAIETVVSDLGLP